MKNKLLIFCMISQIILWSFFLISWTYTFDTDTPLGTDSPSVIDDRIREVKDAVQERENIDHYWPLTGSEVSDADAGKHRQITFRAPLDSDPSSIDEDEGQLYTLDVSSKAELKWIDEDENSLQITDQGTLNIVSADLLGTLANNTYFTAVDAAGTGTVDLIKANTSDVAVIPDGSELATSGAPTEDADIANKKYVDDQVDTQNMTPATYAGEESITFPNGLIFKHGYESDGGATTTVSFGTAFPNSLISITLGVKYGTALGWTGTISSESTSGFTIKDSGAYSGYYWQATGY